MNDHEGYDSFQRSDVALEKSHAMRQADRAQDARRIIIDALSSDPENALLHAELADIYVDVEDFSEAQESAEYALACDPNCHFAMVTLGRCEAEKGLHRKAELHYLEALRVDPEYMGALLAYAALNLKVGELDKSEQLTLHALKVDPDEAAAHQILSLVRNVKNDYAGARAAGAKGLELSPESELSHFAVGANLFESGRPFKGRAHLREAVRLDPTDEETRKAYHNVDRACRIPYLPMYYFSLVADKIPGSGFTIWGIVVAVIIVGPRVGLDSDLATGIAIGWILFAIYSWLADPITRLWVRILPAK